MKTKVQGQTHRQASPLMMQKMTINRGCLFHLMPVEMPGHGSWRNSTWNSGTMMETEGTPMTALDLVEDGPKMNVGLSWSWLHHNRLQHARDGGEGNLDLTWSRGNDSDNDTVNDEVAWMSNWPVTFQFERPDLYPLKLVGLAEEEDKEEELQAEVLFANDLQEQAQAFIDQALEGLEEDDQQ